MSTRQERADFIADTIHPDLLDDAIQWIKTHLSPGEVFDDSQLIDWCMRTTCTPWARRPPTSSRTRFSNNINCETGPKASATWRNNEQNQDTRI